VQHHDDRPAVVARQRAHRVERGNLLAEIEVRRGLVQEEQRGILRHERRQREAPPFAAGERSRIARRRARRGRTPTALPAPARHRRPTPTASARDAGCRPTSAVSSTGGGEVIDAVLRQESADPRALARAECGERRSVVGDLAGSRGPEPGERGDERGLAGAVRPDDGPALARAHVEIEAGGECPSRDRQRQAAARRARRSAVTSGPARAGRGAPARRRAR
jgi:hypothetical protein